VPTPTNDERHVCYDECVGPTPNCDSAPAEGPKLGVANSFVLERR
jgi:hypothetical protein